MTYLQILGYALLTVLVAAAVIMVGLGVFVAWRFVRSR